VVTNISENPVAAVCCIEEEAAGSFESLVTMYMTTQFTTCKTTVCGKLYI
jgi:hypothetical protein